MKTTFKLNNTICWITNSVPETKEVNWVPTLLYPAECGNVFPDLHQARMPRWPPAPQLHWRKSSSLLFFTHEMDWKHRETEDTQTQPTSQEGCLQGSLWYGTLQSRATVNDGNDPSFVWSETNDRWLGNHQQWFPSVLLCVGRLTVFR